MDSKILISRRQKRKQLRNEINVAPIVDVMLVLLIIFMITSPMILAGIDVDLPKTKSAPAVSSEKPLVISVDRRGEIYIFETNIEQKQLLAKLKEITKENKKSKIFVKGDRRLQYGMIVGLIAQIKNAGFTGVALVSDIEQ